MHELSICQALVKQLSDIAAEHASRRIAGIRLRVGPLSGVEPELLRSAYPFASAGTIADGAELDIERAPLRVRCQQCLKESDATPSTLLCAHCGDWHTVLVSGDELLLTGVEFAN